MFFGLRGAKKSYLPHRIVPCIKVKNWNGSLQGGPLMLFFVAINEEKPRIIRG